MLVEQANFEKVLDITQGGIRRTFRYFGIFGGSEFSRKTLDQLIEHLCLTGVEFLMAQTISEFGVFQGGFDFFSASSKVRPRQPNNHSIQAVKSSPPF